MFSGIIETIGIVKNFLKKERSALLRVRADKIGREIKEGESIAINGVCLTVREIKKEYFGVDLSCETLQKTNLGRLKKGAEVNLERAVKIGERLGGHLVTGHIDGIGIMLESLPQGREFFKLRIKADKEIMDYIVPRGTVAVEGVSLTVVSLSAQGFEVLIIPYTFLHTTLGKKKRGSYLNLEGDLLGKYVIKQLAKPKEGLSPGFLKNKGFG